MGCFRLFAISSLFILVVFAAQGRRLINSSEEEEDSKVVLRGEMGSRPPRCDLRRCRSCGPCEAIQVPTNSQVSKRRPDAAAAAAAAAVVTGYVGDSNYKPISWKCKCGTHIFNP